MCTIGSGMHVPDWINKGDISRDQSILTALG